MGKKHNKDNRIKHEKEGARDSQNKKWRVWLWEGKVQQNEITKQKEELFRLAANNNNNKKTNKNPPCV